MFSFLVSPPASGSFCVLPFVLFAISALLLPLSMFKSPFKFARDVYREQYDWIREHEEDKMTVAELIEFFRDTPVDARFYPEKNLFIVQ